MRNCRRGGTDRHRAARIIKPMGLFWLKQDTGGVTGSPPTFPILVVNVITEPGKVTIVYLPAG